MCSLCTVLAHVDRCCMCVHEHVHGTRTPRGEPVAGSGLRSGRRRRASISVSNQYVYYSLTAFFYYSQMA